MSSEKRDFSNAAVEGYPAQHNPAQGYAPQYGGNYAAPPQYGGQTANIQYGQPQAQTQYGQPQAQMATLVTMGAPVRETGTPPDTTCSLVFSILSIFFCLGGWPFAVVAIIYNRKAKTQVDLGQYTVAKSALKTCFIFIAVAVVVGIIAWVIFAIRLKAALDIINRDYKTDTNTDFSYYGK